MSVRIVLIGTDAARQGARLAEAIRATHVVAQAGPRELETALAATTDGFVLDGSALTVAQAVGIDAVLDARAASIDVALWVRTDAAPTPAEDELLAHYRDVIVDVDTRGCPERTVNERVLDAVREASPSLVG
ncbi:MAG: hypothetical protein HIU88_00555 [Acidobacteria bacterium]|nr:hypothetical protein [Acidobacteriota bacterium]